MDAPLLPTASGSSSKKNTTASKFRKLRFLGELVKQGWSRLWHGQASQYTYPFSFWPHPSSWDIEPDTHEWDELLVLNRKRRDNAANEEAQREWRERQSTWPRVKPLQQGVDESQWQGVKILGHGSYGSGTLYVKIDDNGYVEDRMVVKEIWNDPCQWRSHLPREIAIHRLIDESRGNGDPAFSHLPKHRGHRLMMRKRKFRLFTEVCSGGSLYDATKALFEQWERWYKHLEDATDSANATDEERAKDEEPEHIPEAYIWYVFGSLVDACLVLQRGGKERRQKGWKPITHCDIYSANVFLCKDGAAGKEKWPRPVLADFGRAFYELPESENPRFAANPWEFVFSVPALAYAPEQQPLDGSKAVDRDPPVRLDEKTDVFGIGRVMWSLITHLHFNDGVARDSRIHSLDFLYMDRTRDIEEVLTGTFFTAAKHYSQDLKDLVRQCLKREQNSRPSLGQLSQSIRENDGKVSAQDGWDSKLKILSDLDQWEEGKVFRAENGSAHAGQAEESAAG
ncbi:kinase-like protein [Lophiostoma macrostomum CBS 122681]|uniref:Kinase-like protein n=1 Tax=Lophiostoma macrostomum CBS 122681 TaxID=1314788 RepID=A0A6A6T1N5_9PLEO|nr:kinase-like protein [Lophiostoma macrostomum CBS 122681]